MNIENISVRKSPRFLGLLSKCLCNCFLLVFSELAGGKFDEDTCIVAR